MALDSKATVVDAWWPVDLGDDAHLGRVSQEVSRETAGSSDRFDLSTQRASVRGRIPLSSDRGAVSIDADPEFEAAEGSSPDLFGGTAIPIEVRLRRDLGPSAAQMDEVVAWLRTHRIPRAVVGRSAPAPAPAPEPQEQPPQLLQPLVQVEPARLHIWPLAAVSLGLATALLAAIVL